MSHPAAISDLRARIGLREGTSVTTIIRPSRILPVVPGQIVAGTEHVSGHAIRGTYERSAGAGIFLRAADGISRYSEDASRIVHFENLRGLIRRAYITGEPDTFFSIPARVSVGGIKLAGYVSVETIDGYSTPTDDDPAVYTFHPYLYGPNLNHPAYVAG